MSERPSEWAALPAVAAGTDRQGRAARGRHLGPAWSPSFSSSMVVRKRRPQLVPGAGGGLCTPTFTQAGGPSGVCLGSDFLVLLPPSLRRVCGPHAPHTERETSLRKDAVPRPQADPWFGRCIPGAPGCEELLLISQLKPRLGGGVGGRGGRPALASDPVLPGLWMLRQGV